MKCSGDGGGGGGGGAVRGGVAITERFQSRIHMSCAALWSRGNLGGPAQIGCPGAPIHSKANEYNNQ